MYSYSDPQTAIYTGISLGVVVDTSDPQQMGRVRVRVEAYGDTQFIDDGNLPWAVMCTPFAGMIHQTSFSRGPYESDHVDGPLAYGMFNVPKVGAIALVSCLDGDPMTRVVVGYTHVEQTVHTMPHGRYILSEQSDQPAGPVSSKETNVQPLHNNFTKAFGGRNNFEWKTRGADRSVGGLTQSFKSNNPDGTFASDLPDDVNVSVTESDGNKYTRTAGYQKSRLTPDKLDSQVYCWVTPGFHAISMDDSKDNCRMRFRTTTGHQIILDDSNERIYISTNEGANWVEMDSDGSIDIFSDTKVSIHAVGDINLRSNSSIRLDADAGIHIRSGTNVNTTADIAINTHANVIVQSSDTTVTNTAQSFHIACESDINMTAQMIHQNGPEARSDRPEDAFVASRIPEHEPWGRVSTKGAYDRDPKYEYNSPDIGRENKQRNPNWHR